MRQFILLAVISSMCLAADPTPSAWADEWKAEFQEDMYVPVAGKRRTFGTFWYSASKQAFRIERSDGGLDRYCGPSRFFKKEPCTQIVTKGTRYLYYPNDGYCCNCCNEEHGCGIVNADWTQQGVFQTKEIDDAGRTLNKFLVKGLQKNYYWEVDNADHTPYRLF